MSDIASRPEYGLFCDVVQKIVDVFAKHPNIFEVVLYGSRAKGDYKPGSDIDLTLKGKGVTLEQLNTISNELDDLLLPYIFDLSIFDHIKNPDMLGHIGRVGRIFYKREQA